MKLPPTQEQQQQQQWKLMAESIFRKFDIFLTAAAILIDFYGRYKISAKYIAKLVIYRKRKDRTSFLNELHKYHIFQL